MSPSSLQRADLHLHTTCSDGSYTPAQLVELARRCGLAAIAITDHDTLEGIPEAQAASENTLEVVPGIELTACLQSRLLHVLGYFFRPDDAPLAAALRQLRERRVERFHVMAERLRSCGVSLPPDELEAEAAGEAPGRRHLAQLLVKARRVGSLREAFARYLGDEGRVAIPELGLPVEEAIALLRGAGGVAAWAHPWAKETREVLLALRAVGLGAVEVEYPTFKRRRVRELRALATELGLAVTGGSDCHGPGRHGSAVGARGVTMKELELLRQASGVA
jgi:hypothetical protein